MNRRQGLWLVLLAMGMLLAACYEKPHVTFFKPGVYQGRTDPLLALEASAEQQQKLEQRLRTGQMDR
jgi:hypothetical protein